MNRYEDKIELTLAYYEGEKRRIFFFCKSKPTKDQVKWLNDRFKIKRIYLDKKDDEFIRYDDNYESSKLKQYQYMFFDFYIYKDDFDSSKNDQPENREGNAFENKMKSIWKSDYNEWNEQDHDFCFVFDHDNRFVKVQEVHSKYHIKIDDYGTFESDKAKGSKMAISSPYFMGVDHGLSYIDFPNKFIYDAGGSISEDEYIEKINRIFPGMIGFNLYISHVHYDHYKYALKLLKDGKVNKVYFGEKVNKSWNTKKVLKSINSQVEYIKDWERDKSGNYTFRLPQKVMKKSLSTNERSVICYSNEVLLTGDSTYKIIGETIKDSGIQGIYWEVFQIPHHGAKNDLKNLWATLNLMHSDNLFISSKGIGAKHPHPELISELKSRTWDIYIIHKDGNIKF